MTFEKFPNPPIKEAIFTIKFKEDLSIEQLGSFRDRPFISGEYPTSKKSVIRQIKAGAQDQDPSIYSLHDGFVLDSGNKLIQARKSHLSYHRVNKYDNWDSLIDDFKKVCSELEEVIGPDLLISESSVRYINKIAFLDQNIREYFKLLPLEVEGLPKKISNMFLQVTFPFGDLSGIITEVIEHSKSENPNFVIDLKVINSSIYSISDLAIWEVFSRMRNYKNELFFSIINEKAKQLFR